MFTQCDSGVFDLDNYDLKGVHPVWQWCVWFGQLWFKRCSPSVTVVFDLDKCDSKGVPLVWQWCVWLVTNVIQKVFVHLVWQWCVWLGMNVDNQGSRNKFCFACTNKTTPRWHLLLTERNSRLVRCQCEGDREATLAEGTQQEEPHWTGGESALSGLSSYTVGLFIRVVQLVCLLELYSWSVY